MSVARPASPRLPYSVSLYEVPLPSSRTRREMSTLMRRGFEVSVVHNPRYRDRIEAEGYASVPAYVGRPHPLVTDLRRRIADAGSAAAGSGTAGSGTASPEARVWARALELPTPQLRARPADLNVLVHNWITAAEALATTRPHLFWAADLDALPAVVWAASSSPGSKVVFDAHELFTELDYLDPLQMGEWDDIAATFVPHADLVLTVGEDVGAVFAERYGARRVEVVPNLAEAASPSEVTVRRLLGLAGDTPLAVHIGNVVANRRPELAVELLARLPELHVAFVGEVRNGLDVMLAEQAEGVGVAERLHLVAPVPGPQLVEFTSDADVSLILYSPSRSRHLELTMPNKLYDSLAAGLPVVSTAGLAPTRFVVERGLGVAFDDDAGSLGDAGAVADAASLADAVRAVLADAALRDRVRRGRDDYLWPAGEKHLVEVIESIASQAHPEPVAGERAAASAAGALAPGSAAPAGRGGRVARRVKKAVAWRLRRLAARLDR